MRGAALASGTAGAQVLAGPAILFGYSVRESAGTPAVASLVIRNGTSSAGAPVAFITLPASGSTTITLPEIDCPNGVFVDRLAGTTEVVLFTG
jgi:hypothetical protein